MQLTDPDYHIPSALDTGPAAPWDDAPLVERIIAAYNFAIERFSGYGESMWARLNHLNADVHDALTQADAQLLTSYLRNPHTTDLFYGFENLARTLLKARTNDLRAEGQMFHARLVQLAEALGAIRAHNPEQKNPTKRDLSIGTVLAALDSAFGARLIFPNPFPFERGLPSDRGIISKRAIAAVYQAWRIKSLAKNKSKPRILEIGAGLGRTVYFCHQLGLRDYTVIDLPMANVAQANFLGRALPSSTLILAGEDDMPGGIRLFDASYRPRSDERFDVAINVDSLTEMDPNRAQEYVALIARQCDVFLSINHEVNRFTVRELTKSLPFVLYLRNRHWIRDGYVEEIVWFKP